MSETSADKHQRILSRGGLSGLHRSGAVTTAHKKECARYREVARENYLMASKLAKVQMRSNKFLFGGKQRSNSHLGLDKPDSYAERVRKERVKQDNLRLYMNIIETRPTKQTNLNHLI